MPALRVTFFFEVGSFGWTETYFRTDDFSTVEAPVKALAVKRSALLTKGAFLSYIRVSDDAVFRDAMIIEPPLELPEKNLKAIEGAPPFVSLLVRMENGVKYWRFLFLRPLPKAAININNQFTLNANWLDPWVGFKNQLLLGWGFKVIEKAGINPEKAVESYTQNAGQVTVTSTAHGLQSGDEIRIYGGQGVGRPKGNQFVVRVSNDTFTLVKTFPVFQYSGGSKFTTKKKSIVPITGSLWERVNHRDTGRPFGQSRGRQAAKK